MAWAINISRESEKIKIILEGIDYKLVSMHVEKIIFRNEAIVLLESRDLRFYSASSSENATNRLSQLQT
jgi:hypothetical protein